MDWNLCAAQWVRFAPSDDPKHPSRSGLSLRREMRSSPRRGNWPLIVSKWWLWCQRITYHLVCDGSTVSSGWRKEAWQLRRKTVGNRPAKQLCQLLTGAQEPWSGCPARDLLRWLGYWSCQLASGFAARMAAGEGEILQQTERKRTKRLQFLGQWMSWHTNLLIGASKMLISPVGASD